MEGRVLLPAPPAPAAVVINIEAREIPEGVRVETVVEGLEIPWESGLCRGWPYPDYRAAGGGLEWFRTGRCKRRPMLPWTPSISPNPA